MLAAQGLDRRPRRKARKADVLAAIRRMAALQIDTISVVNRSPYLVLWTRVGDFEPRWLDALLAEGAIFEYWAHEACLLPIESWPHFRRAMGNGGRGWYGAVAKTHPHLADEILAEIRERGPLASRHFEGAAGGGMWNWKPAKAMLERLWNHGDLVIAGRQGFQRVYDLAQRVIPQAQLQAPIPSEHETLRTLAEQAVRARGVLTETGVKEHWRLRGGVARIRPALDELVAEGRLRRLRVDDGGADVLVAADAELDLPAPRAAVLVSPFDNLLWDRLFARRILGFDHLIEVYKPAPQRRYGYYVLPFLRGDRVVGRADLKSERQEGRLVVRAFHREDSVRRSGALDDALDRALGRLARTIGLAEVVR